MPNDSPPEFADVSRPKNARRWKYACIGGAFAGVAILGGLALASFTAFRQTRNRALETSLLGEARQISSAAAQYMSEHDTDTVTMKEIGRYIQGGPGGGKTVSVDGVIFQTGDYARMSGTLKKDGTFYVAHPYYVKSLTGRATLLGADGGEHGLRFYVDTGAAVIPGSATVPARGGR